MGKRKYRVRLALCLFVLLSVAQANDQEIPQTALTTTQSGTPSSNEPYHHQTDALQSSGTELGVDQPGQPSIPREPPSPADIAKACTHHTRALDLLASLPANPPRSLIPPQTFITLSTSNSDPAGRPSRIHQLIHNLRQRFWKEGYEARLPAGGKETRSTGKLGKVEADILEKSREILTQLDKALDGGCPDAWGTRGHIAMFPPAPMRQNLKLAYHAFSEHARLTGNSTAQYMLGFFHSTGYGDVVPVDQGKALLYYSFAALQNHPGAEQSLAYKYWAGIGVKEDCMMALEWYRSAAEQMYSHFLTGPKGGRTLPITSTRLSDLAGGVYGLGASWASTGLNANRAAIRAGIARSGGETWDDILDYYKYHSERGSPDYSYRLGRFYYMGSIYTAPGGHASGAEGAGRITQSFDLATSYFLKATRLLWPSDLSGNSKQRKASKEVEIDRATLEAAVFSAGFLGRMNLRGEGGKGKPDYAKAKLWFERGVDHGERESHNGLGILYRDGLGVKKDMAKAKAHFEAAAALEHAEAQINLAKLLSAQGEPSLATKYLQLSLRNGSPFEGYYHLGSMYASSAKMQADANLRPDTCGPAVTHLKLVVERGCWKDNVVGAADQAWERGETDKAFLGWWMAAERGYESAQNNLAYLLDQDTPLYSLPWRSFEPSNATAKLALDQWTRSAAQGEIDSLVKVGDYFYKGLDGSGEPQYEKAAGYYQAATERQDSALALFNLGHMYENGLGVPKDWHLAKRNYDLALETNVEASLPVHLALSRLYVRSLWSTLTGGPEKGIFPWSSAESKKTSSAAGSEGGGQNGVGSWSVRSIGEAIAQRWTDLVGELDAAAANGGGAGRAEDEWDSAGEFGAADEYFDEGDWTAMGRRQRRPNGEHNDDDDEEVWFETILLVVLCFLVGFFAWLRARWTRQQAQEREAAQQPAGQAPPPPAQPAFVPRQDIPGPPWHPLA